MRDAKETRITRFLSPWRFAAGDANGFVPIGTGGENVRPGDLSTWR